MSDDEKKDEDLKEEDAQDDAEDEAGDEKGAEDKESEEKPKEKKESAASARRGARGGAASGQPVKAVVPMWLWVGSVVVLLVFAGGICLRDWLARRSLEKRLKGEIETAAQKAAQDETKITEQARELSKLRDERDGAVAEGTRLKAQMTGTQKRLVDSQKRNEALGKRLDDTEASLKAAQDKLDNFDKETAGLKDKLAKTEAGLAKTEKALDHAQKQMESQKEIAKKEVAARNDLEQRIGELKEHNKFLEEDRNKWRDLARKAGATDEEEEE